MHAQVVIVGAGFAGLGAAIRLKQQGYADFVVLERASALGGTWRDNSYPGCACDVPSHLYSFSFAPNPAWSRTFSSQQEIWNYLEACADRFGVRQHIRFNTDLRGASWEEATRRWRLDTSQGDLTADLLISAGGGLNEPSVPKLIGLETFQGTIFHSAYWDHRHNLTGRDVAVVGTGASAIQFVPEIQPKVGKLTLFQRTPPWVMPRRERAMTEFEHRAYQKMPLLQRLMRVGIYWARESFAIGFLHPRAMRIAQASTLKNLRASVPDPTLRAKLTPNYTMGCKRILQSNTYYPALMQDNVEVVTEPILAVRPHGIVTRDGVERPVDTIIFGTGFRASDLPISERIRGRDGRSLAEVWQGSPQAYRGTTVAGFPNLFLLLGPNTGLGHTSILFMMESQLAYVLDALRHMRRRRIWVLEPKIEAQQRFVTAVDKRLSTTVWGSGGCRSWYMDGTGRNFALWPGYTWRFRQAMRRFDVDAYEVSR
jgi:cation diffusion facilitator CzcD-associated flavoprotein CzcO